MLKALRRFLAYLLYERRYGLQTSQGVELEELGLADPQRVGYFPSGWLTLRRILDPAEVSSDDVFADFGSGKGRIVVLAARYPFKRVIGVELSPELHEVARRNVERNRRRLDSGRIELVNADALDYEIPDDLTVAYFFNPFKGDIFAGVLDRLLRSLDSNPRTLRLIYVNPVEDERVLATGRATVVRTVQGPGGGDRTRSVTLYELR
jgi:SAM-dependent methyltransferase